MFSQTSIFFFLFFLLYFSGSLLVGDNFISVFHMDTVVLQSCNNLEIYLSLTTYMSICENMATRLITFVTFLEEACGSFKGLMSTGYFWKLLAANMKKMRVILIFFHTWVSDKCKKIKWIPSSVFATRRSFNYWKKKSGVAIHAFWNVSGALPANVSQCCWSDLSN